MKRLNEAAEEEATEESYPQFTRPDTAWRSVRLGFLLVMVDIRATGTFWVLGWIEGYFRLKHVDLQGIINAAYRCISIIEILAFLSVLQVVGRAFCLFAPPKHNARALAIA